MEAGASGGTDESLICVPSTPEITQKDIKGLWIFGESESKRRVVLIERKNGSYGFTLQSYGVRYKHGNRETDFITYVNAVEKKGAAHQAGLREGDVILSINGQNMARVEHKSLVGFIRQCPANLKMVVVSDERARKVELHMRYVHLQKKLQDKIKELEELNLQEKQILTGTYTKPTCGGPSHLGGPCLAAAASKVCCFCPPQSQKKESIISGGTSRSLTSTTTTTAILQPKSEVEEAMLKHVIQQRSKSVKLPTEKDKSIGGSGSGSGDIQYYYDCYRKCQSSRELNSSSVLLVSRKDSNINLNSGCPATPPVGLNSSTQHHHHHHHYQRNDKSGQVKPKSWDSLVGTGTTKSFGGYGFGFGYGYFPSSKDKEIPMSGTTGSGGYTTSMTHPHHHNHHIHNHSTHAQNPYYKSQKHDGSASKVKVVYNYVAPTYHTMLPNSSLLNSEDTTIPYKSINTHSKRFGEMSPIEVNESTTRIGHRSKTLPSTRGTSSKTSSKTPPFPKLEKTFSDSSLSDHYKEWSKTVGYFKRSGDNVRFSSEEDFEIYRVGHGHGQDGNIGILRKTKSAKERERIFV